MTEYQIRTVKSLREAGYRERKNAPEDLPETITEFVVQNDGNVVWLSRLRGQVYRVWCVGKGSSLRVLCPNGYTKAQVKKWRLTVGVHMKTREK